MKNILLGEDDKVCLLEISRFTDEASYMRFAVPTNLAS